jgi:DNA-binding transcriptional LysR family regulator
MNLIDAYRYLAALEQHRHFGRAAVACHITQPALSNALRALETHLGVAIVRRGRHYEGLTDEGVQVLATAHRVLHEQEALQQELARRAGQPQGRLVLAAVPTALPLAARFAARLVERAPGLLPQLRSMSSQDIETGLAALSVDLGLGFAERVHDERSLRLLPQVVEHYFVLSRHAGPWRLGPPLPWAEAAALPLALLSPEMHHRSIVERVFKGLGLGQAVRPVLETNSVAALLAVAQGSGIHALLPGALVGTLRGQPGLQARPLVAPELRTPLGFMHAAAARPSLALQTALALAADADWLAEAQAHSGALLG